MHWQTSRFLLTLDRPLVMGIVNVTPDSFSDGGQHASASAARVHCDRLLAEGADILDIGGESTRPGAGTPTVAEEIDRVMPALEHALTLGIPVSVDTSRPEVMQAAMDAGVDIINDVRALTWPGALACATAHPSAGICLMHMRGQPDTMQAQAHYQDIVTEVADFLGQRLQAVTALGVKRRRVVLDPGYGFAKTADHNLALWRRQRDLLALGRPLLVGWSRKSGLGQLTGRAVSERLPASLAAALASVALGASIVRVHDVAATVDALKVWRAAGLMSPLAARTDQDGED
jgi:dihydropteroate synthase